MSFARLEAQLEPPEADECPECGAPVVVDEAERSVECTECEYADGFDWDAEAERRAEAREMDDPGREVW